MERQTPTPQPFSDQARMDWEVRAFLFETQQFRAHIERSERCGWCLLTSDWPSDGSGDALR